MSVSRSTFREIGGPYIVRLSSVSIELRYVGQAVVTRRRPRRWSELTDLTDINVCSETGIGLRMHRSETRFETRENILEFKDSEGAISSVQRWKLSDELMSSREIDEERRLEAQKVLDCYRR